MIKKELSVFQVVCLICTSFLPLMFWLFPRFASARASVDGQWAVLGACIVAIFSAWMHGILNLRYPTSTGAEMGELILGKYIGKLITALYIPGYLLFVSISLYSFSISIKALLPNTPRWATMAALALVSISGAINGLEAIGRASSLIFPVVMLVLGVSFIFIMRQGSWYGIFFRIVSFKNTALGVYDLLPIFLGLNLYLMFSPHFVHLKRRAVWIPLFSVGLSSFVIMGIYVITVRVIGYEGIAVLTHPVDFVLQLIELHGIIIQRFGLVLVFLSTMFEAVFLSNHLWGISDLTIHLSGRKEGNNKVLIVTYALIIYILFSLIRNQDEAEWVILYILVPLCWIYLIIIPTILVLGSYMAASSRTNVQHSGKIKRLKQR